MSYTKSGPGRVASIGEAGFTRRKAAFLEAMKSNPVNRLSGRELWQLERLRLTTSAAIWEAAERIISSREKG